MKLATLCYLRQNGKTLMVHRIKKPNDIHEGKWNGLGGKFEPGETPEECARREIFEESGLRVKKLVLKGLLTFPLFARDEDWYAFVFVATDFEGSLIESPEGTLQWIDDAKLLDLNLWDRATASSCPGWSVRVSSPANSSTRTGRWSIIRRSSTIEVNGDAEALRSHIAWLAA